MAVLQKKIVRLSLLRESPYTDTYRQVFKSESVLKRLRALDARVQRDGLKRLDAADKLVAIGTETNGNGAVTKNGYGVFNLPWRAERNPAWVEEVTNEVQTIRQSIRQAHGVTLRVVIWAGMGGSSEDKAAYCGAKLLRRGPRLYILDSTDPSKLRNILDDARRRTGLSMKQLLKSSLIVGMAMGMTSYEPVVNLQALACMYERFDIDSRPNFLYLTIPNSLLDRFGQRRGYRRVELQLDGKNTTAGRHSAPMTRGALYPLALAKHDLRAWIEGAFLEDESIELAWQLAAFLHAHGVHGQEKVTLVLPRELQSLGLWTKQAFEESLGKSESIGIKIVIDEPLKLTEYKSPRDSTQDRVFVHVSLRPGARKEEKVRALYRAGYPLALLQFGPQLQISTYQQFIHYVVFGLAYLRNMNFVTQPGVELYKSITNRLFAEAKQAGGIENTKSWRALLDPAKRVVWKGGLTLSFPFLVPAPHKVEGSAPEIYAKFLLDAVRRHGATYGELTFFGDLRYSRAGPELLKRLKQAASLAFRRPFKIPVDVYEGPAMNHSYHEMIIGHGKCFSTVLLSLKTDEFTEAAYTSEYHRAQFVATQLALSERGRQVVSILLRDLESSSLRTLGEFFRAVAQQIKILQKRTNP
jgi:glucose-6-phosphate isomerase